DPVWSVRQLPEIVPAALRGGFFPVLAVIKHELHNNILKSINTFTCLQVSQSKTLSLCTQGESNDNASQ
ncbi:hypothetical protein, partial [Kosakonia cowanii]|uniref:hypothetical protein n=1 Tax=Kosakonia cowanii TaxID=208223 RepID=UPI00289FAB54